MGKCSFGISGKSSEDGSVCRFAHPKKCPKFVKFAHQNGGCPLKHSECKFLHPIVCYHARHGRECRNRDCTLLHPTGLAVSGRDQSQGMEDRPPRFQSPRNHSESQPLASPAAAAAAHNTSFLERVEQMQSAFQAQMTVIQEIQRSQWLFQQKIEQQLNNQQMYKSHVAPPPGFVQKPMVPMPGAVQNVY